MNNKEHFTYYFEKIKEALDNTDTSMFEPVVQAIVETFEKQGTIYIFGNGGSSSTASHVAGDWVKGVCYGLEGKRLKIICLNDNFPVISAISNDISYEHIFVEQLKNYCEKDDLVIGISGSGNSENILKAFEYASQKGSKTIAFVGYKGGKAKKTASHSIHMPVDDMEMVEDLHLLCFHAIKQRLIQMINVNQSSLGEKYDNRME